MKQSYKDEIKTKAQLQTEQQILYIMAQILEICPQYTFAQHLWHILRPKGKDKEPYYWSTENLLNKTEQYYDEIKTDLVNTSHEEE